MQVARNRVFSLAVAGMIALLCTAFMPGDAMAFQHIGMQKHKSTYYLPISKSGYDGHRFVADTIDTGIKLGGELWVSEVKSKNLVVESQSDGILIWPKKAGKAWITYKYRGVKHKISFVFKKYANPIKTLKIGKTNYAKKFKSYSSWLPSKKKSGKIRVKAAKGWKLVAMKTNGKSLKNGSKVTVDGSGNHDLKLTFKNKKTKVTQNILLGLGPEGE